MDSISDPENLFSFPLESMAYQMEDPSSSPKIKGLTKIYHHRQQLKYCIQNLLFPENSSNVRLSRITNGILEKLKNKKKFIQSKTLFHPLTHPLNHPFTHDDRTLTKEEILDFLKEKSFLSLVEKIESHQGKYWDELLTIKYPFLMEQVADIICICELKIKDKDSLFSQSLIQFALELAQIRIHPPHHFPQINDCLKDIREIIGEFAFLIDQQLPMALLCLDCSSKYKTIINIKKYFNTAVHEIYKRLAIEHHLHEETQLQNTELALVHTIPLEVAKLILLSNGSINIGLISPILDLFIPNDSIYLNQKINLTYTLNLLENSPRFRWKIKKISKPKSPSFNIEEVIKITLQLPQNTKLEDREYQLTALTAILSHLRQGEDGSCFAVSLAIEILSSHLSYCLDEFRQLLKKGSLFRHVSGDLKEFTFIKKIRDDNLNKNIFFDNKGNLLIGLKKRGSLWTAPGIIAACQSIGIEDCQTAVFETIQKLPTLSKGSIYQMKIKKFIQCLCLDIHQHEEPVSECLAHHFSQAYFAYSSKVTHPFLKIWENCIACMAEAEEGSVIKRAISDAILDALQFKLGEENIPDSEVVKMFLLTIQKIIYHNINIQYDPDIRRDLLTESQNKEAGFILYYNSYRIDNQIKFINFILLLINISKEKTLNKLNRLVEKEELDCLLNVLIPYIPSYQFICFVLIKYYPANKELLKIAAKKRNYSTYQFQYTPWITKIGSNSKALMKVYFEKENMIEAESFIVRDSEHALMEMIDFCKKMKSEDKFLFYNNPNKSIPFCITGRHRFPFMPGHPSLLRAWNDTALTKEWLETFVIQPGMEVANSLIDKNTCKKLIRKIEKNVLPHFFTPEITKIIFNQIDRIDKRMKIKAYRDMILNMCEQEITVFSKIEHLRRKIDTELCNCLPFELKTKLENSTVYFGDTNWACGIHDLHFCFLVNPGTGKLELFESYSNGTHLKALDQNYWLINQKWEFLTKEDLLLDDFNEK